MQNHSPVSNNKIIVLVVFVAAAIMTSLFVYHMNHKPLDDRSLANKSSVIFTAARDIKPADLFVSQHEKLSKTIFLQHWTLLFFGFTHCASICPTTLDKLNHVYNKLRLSHPNLQVVFISLDPQRDTPDEINKYARSFNAEFIGATGNLQELRKLQSQLGIFSMQEKSPAQKMDYQLMHTSSVLLINPQGKWAGMLNANMSVDEFVSQLENNVKVLSEQHHPYV